INADQAKAMADAIAVLKREGAIVVDPAEVPTLAEKDPKSNFAAWDFCSGADQAKGKDESCSVAFKYGMKRDFNLWLKSLGATAPVTSLTALREWNLAHAKAGAIFTPGGSGAGLAARAGYPIIVVPFAMVPNAPTPPLPAGFDAKPAPFGVGFTGAQCSEPRLIELAYAFEQATKK